MKKRNSLLAFIMCMVLAAGCLTGCGGKSEEEVFMGAVTALNSAKSFDMNAALSGKMSLKMGEESTDVDLSTTMKGVCFTDPYKMKMTTSITTAGQTTSTETYMQQDGDHYFLYASDDSSWSKMELGDMDTAIQASGMNNVAAQLATDISKYTKKENKTEDDKTYLVYDYTVAGEDIKEMVESMSSSLGSIYGDSVDSSEMETLLNKMVEDIGNITMTIYVDQEEGSVSRIEYPMTDMMNKMLASIIDYIKENTENSDEDTVDIATALSSIEMSVSDMNMVITYGNINSAEEFEIPEEALNAETVDADGLVGDSSGEDAAE